MDTKKRVIFIVGPTAVGKTAFAIRLAGEISGEIVSADSMQAYRRIDIMSQRPTAEELKKAPHHLVGILDVKEEYSAADFALRAREAICGIIERGASPIVTGGSGLYVKALADGLFPSPKKDPAFRDALERRAGEFGTRKLHEDLKGIDPGSAGKIHPNDKRRLIRALEIFHLTGATKTEHIDKTEGIKRRYEIKTYALTRPRDILNKRIDERVDAMFAGGLVDEVARARMAGPGMTAEAALGYKEVAGYLDDIYPLDEAKALLKKNTRRFAKRQMTWLRADKRAILVDIEALGVDAAFECVLKDIEA